MPGRPDALEDFFESDYELQANKEAKRLLLAYEKYRDKSRRLICVSRKRLRKIIKRI